MGLTNGIGHLRSVELKSLTEFPPQLRGQFRRCSKSPAVITAKTSSPQKS
ncbi:hypothetical protein ACVWXO_005932 [Bradyrhizobium sp. LM2.7]